MTPIPDFIQMFRDGKTPNEILAALEAAKTAAGKNTDRSREIGMAFVRYLSWRDG